MLCLLSGAAETLKVAFQWSAQLFAREKAHKSFVLAFRTKQQTIRWKQKTWRDAETKTFFRIKTFKRFPRRKNFANTEFVKKEFSFKRISNQVRHLAVSAWRKHPPFLHLHLLATHDAQPISFVREFTTSFAHSQFTGTTRSTAINYSA